MQSARWNRWSCSASIARTTFGQVAAPTEFTFIPDGDNRLAFDNVTRASNAIIFLNTGQQQVCWTPPSRVSPGGPSTVEKENTRCIDTINLNYASSGDWN